MSFSDLEAGLTGGNNSSAGTPLGVTQLSDSDRDYNELVRKISNSVLEINKDVTDIRSTLEQLGRNEKSDLGKLNKRTKETSEKVKKTNGQIRSLGVFSRDVPIDTQRRRKIEQGKLLRDFERVAKEFKRVKQLALERTREFKDRANVRSPERTSQNNTKYDDPDYYEDNDTAEQRPLLGDDGQRLQLHRLMENEVQFNDALIQERAREVDEITQGINDLNEITRNLGTIVTEQQSLLDNIERNVSNVAIHTRRAGEEVTTASRYQRRARTLMCYLLFILSVILAFIILLVFVV